MNQSKLTFPVDVFFAVDGTTINITIWQEKCQIIVGYTASDLF